ncbi:MAG TPA: WhiB family transcriptional regulator [Acidimicrobiia bacterium]
MRFLGWKNRASCLEDPGGHWDGELLPSMFLMCMDCPVKFECLAEGLEHEERSDCGVWGGTNPEQRKAIKKGADPYEVWYESAKDLVPT